MVLFEPAGPCTSTSSSSSTTNTTTTTLPSLMREVVSSEISRLYLIHHHRHQQQQNDQPLQLLKIGIMRSQSLEPYNTPSPPSSSLLAIEDFYLGSIPEQVAHNLYSGLRDLEARGVNVILVEGVGEDREGYAVMNRLKKAASRTIRLKL